MKKIRENAIPPELFAQKVYLYGAGYTAKVCVTELEKKGIEISALVDDDEMKWGKYVEGYPVISYQDFSINAEKCNVILMSIYGKAIYNKLKTLKNVTVWEMYEWYTNLLNQQEFVIEKYCEGEKLEAYRENTLQIKGLLADQESWSCLDNIYSYFKTKDTSYLTEICTTEESYFIKEVKEYFKDRECNIVDAGAYEGELLRGIISAGLNVKNWYCFELDSHNYQRLKENLKGTILPKSMSAYAENLGLWNENVKLPIVEAGTASKVTNTVDSKNYCNMITMDTYFQDKMVDMIKMDIEGAEMNALKGGINVIRRDRPVLAISIYHYVEDYYGILRFLNNNLHNYKWYIRQHALIYGETVLYGIPY